MSTVEERRRRIEAAFNNPAIIQAAIARGVADARLQYARAGHPMATWRKGKVVWVDPMTGAEMQPPPERQEQAS